MFQFQVPVHKIMFLDPSPQAPVGLHNPQGGRGHVIDEVPFVKQLITSLSVTDRPDLMVLVRKGSDTGSASRYGKTANTDDGDSASEGSGGRNSVSSMDNVMRGGKFNRQIPSYSPILNVFRDIFVNLHGCKDSTVFNGKAVIVSYF